MLSKVGHVLKPGRRVAALFVAFLSLAALSAIGVSARAASSASPRWIVFAATAPGAHTNQLFRIRSSGAGLKQITHGALSSIAPAFSPDGKLIAFARAGVGILAVKLDGTGLRRLTTNGRDSFPAWSPDGTRIAFVRPDKSGWHVYVMSSSGGAQTRLRQAPPAGRPSWRAAGLLIPAGGDLLRIESTTGHVQKFYDANIDAIWGLNTVAVSPDASTITFVGSRQPDLGDNECGEAPCERFALYIEDVIKSKKPKLLVKDAGPATFTGDGRQVVFVAKNALVLWTLATRATRVIATGQAFPSVAAPPAWQPR
jgi:Tol biopolymer transport system component